MLYTQTFRRALPQSCYTPKPFGGRFHSLVIYPNLSEGADRVGGQLHGDKECLFNTITNSGRVWRKVPERDARSQAVVIPYRKNDRLPSVATQLPHKAWQLTEGEIQHSASAVLFRLKQKKKTKQPLSSVELNISSSSFLFYIFNLKSFHISDIGLILQLLC